MELFVPPSPIRFHSEFPNFIFRNKTIIRKWINDVVVREKKSCGEVNFIFCDDTYLLRINKNYLQHDFYTDVISFDYTTKKNISGDIFISISRVKENSSTLKQPFETELHRVMIHGILHLLGYTDKGKVNQQLMRKKEDKYLSLL